MRRTSIMIEFSDEVYDAIVEPMKKQKTFSKLVASLVEGYLEDGYIRAYADDTLEDMRKASVSSFSASIDSMAESLSSMGLYTDELNSISLTGKTKFQEKAKKQSDEMKNMEKPTSNDNGVSAEVIENINKRIDNMENSIDSKFSELIELLKAGVVTKEVEKSSVDNGNFSNDKPAVDVPNTPPRVVSFNNHNVEENASKEDLDNLVISSNDDFFGTSGERDITEDVFEDTDSSKDEEGGEATSFVNSLLDGNSFAF